MPSEILPIESVINSDSDTIFQYFPPLEDQEIQTKLNNFSDEVVAIDQLLQKIKDYFVDLKQNFDTILVKVEANMKKNVSTLENYKQIVLEQYNKISSKQELKEMFEQNQDEVSIIFDKILKQKTEQMRINTETISHSIQQYGQLLHSFNIEIPNEIKESILKMASEIDFFSGTDVNQLNERQQLQQQCKTNIPSQINFKGNDDLIIELISNKTNFCSEEFLNQIKDLIKKYQNIFNNNINLNEQGYDRNKRDCFNQLNDLQLENMRQLCSNILQNQNQNVLTDDSNSQIVLKELNRIYLEQQTQAKLSNLLIEYPIFDLIQQPLKLQSLTFTNFIKSQIIQPQNYSVEKVNSGEVVCTVVENQQYCNAYGNFILNQNKKYVIRLMIYSNSNSTDTWILFGLTRDDLKDTSLLYKQAMCYCERGNEYGMNQILKGRQLHQGSQSNLRKQFEIRIHLKDKIFKISEYPNYENVCGLSDTSKIKENISYRFATEMYYKNDKIIINYINEVDQFDNLM